MSYVLIVSAIVSPLFSAYSSTASRTIRVFYPVCFLVNGLRLMSWFRDRFLFDFLLETSYFAIVRFTSERGGGYERCCRNNDDDSSESASGSGSMNAKPFSSLLDVVQ